MDIASSTAMITDQAVIWGGNMIAIVAGVLGATFLFTAVKIGIKRVYAMFVK